MNRSALASRLTRRHSVRFMLCVLLVVLLAGSIGGPVRVSAQTMLLPSSMMARVIHASPDAPSLDVYLDGIPVISDMTFGEASRYLPLETGDHTLAVVPTGGSVERQALAEIAVTLEVDQFALIMIQGYLNELALSVSPVDASLQDETGYARLRLIHAVPDVPLGELLLPDGQPVFADAVSLEASVYEGFQAGQHELLFRPVGSDSPIDVPVSVKLLPDISYDLIVIGEDRTRSISTLVLPTPTAQSCGQYLGLGGADTGCLSVVHGSPDLGPVDVYLGAEPQLVVAGLVFGSASPPIPLPPEAVELRFVPGGASPDDPFETDTALAEDGKAVLLSLTGPADRLVIDRFDHDLTPLAGSQARIQVIHEVDGASTLDTNLNGTPLVQALLEGESSEPRLIAEGDYRFEITATDDGSSLLSSGPIPFAAGTTSSVFILGSLATGITILPVSLQVPTDRELPAA